MSEFKPYVAAEQRLSEFTIRSIVAGALLGILFGGANAYLGLRVGLTISTSIPIAVMSVALFRVLQPVIGPSNILEQNIVKTAGSASSSLASGIIFTIPALFMWGFDPGLVKIATLATLGATLGILFMIPLRPLLIVAEHHTLPYPEGTAAAQVLIAADAGGTRARNVFVGLGVGALVKGLISFALLWPGEVDLAIPFLDKGVIGMEMTAALLGVGYILGYRIGAIMVGGGLLASLGIIPIIAHFGKGMPGPVFPEKILPIAEMSAGDIWNSYVRYIGAGAVAFAGIVTAARALPTMSRALMGGVRGFRREGGQGVLDVLRTDRDLGAKAIIAGILAVVIVIIVSPYTLGEGGSLVIRLLGAMCIVVFAFLFVTVSSRIVGLVGVTSNPTSGMAIVTLIATSVLFYLIGWTDLVGQATVLTVGTVVCVAASIAGDVSQDLKTGFLLGSTPRYLQISELLGAWASAIFVAGAVVLLGKTYAFGSKDLAAPQATLMKTVIEGVLQANLPWGLVLSGAGITLVVMLLQIPALAFAVGVYLPVATMTPLFVGGCIRRYVEYRATRDGIDPEASAEQGILLGSGFIAGEGLMGVAIALYAFIRKAKPEGIGFALEGAAGEIAAVAAFAFMGWMLWRSRIRKAAA
ncbi:MAG TPA: oligopeptide transporter, OPT family [Candidatus Saccharimonadales bacterium]|nr:oligopeptide transporter, OPT family [Candidatus Saccharimonadales bacterium]